MEPIPLQASVGVVARHPAGIVAVNKPGGIRSHPNRDGRDERALLTVPYDAHEEAYRMGKHAWYLCNRLDAPTSGVLVLVTDAALAQQVKALFAARKVEKSYTALLKGRLRSKHEVWRDRVRTRRTRDGLRSQVAFDGDPAVTERLLQSISSGPPWVSRVTLRPKTGRTHQLRVQAAHRHTPIVGDATYGDFRFNRDWARRKGAKRLYLHSEQLQFEIEWQGQHIAFCARADAPF